MSEILKETFIILHLIIFLSIIIIYANIVLNKIVTTGCLKGETEREQLKARILIFCFYKKMPNSKFCPFFILKQVSQVCLHLQLRLYIMLNNDSPSYTDPETDNLFDIFEEISLVFHYIFVYDK